MFNSFVKFTGIKNTSKSFLENLKEASIDRKSLLQNLADLKIFTSIVDGRKMISLTEKPKSLKMNFTARGNRVVFLDFPNIFGEGENLKIEAELKEKKTEIFKKENKENEKNTVRTYAKTAVETVGAYLKNKLEVKSIRAEISKPFLFNGLFFTAGKAIKEIVTFDDVSYEKKRAEIAVRGRNCEFLGGLQKINSDFCKFIQFNLKNPLINFTAEIGQQNGKNKKTENSPKTFSEYKKKVFEDLEIYSKFIANKTVRLNMGRFFVETSLGVGKIMGNCHFLEKFFMSIRGYKKRSIGPVSENIKTGGTSCFSLATRAGVQCKQTEMFAFWDAAVTTQSSFRECFKALENNDSCSVGKSVGVGIQLNESLSFIYAIPLTNSLETESFHLGFDMKF
ncbi:hypothetical protein NUSPORA_00925 [Nucleospora cyclopteri]